MTLQAAAAKTIFKGGGSSTKRYNCTLCGVLVSEQGIEILLHNLRCASVQGRPPLQHCNYWSNCTLCSVLICKARMLSVHSA